jgi:hypothetical protein
MCFNSNLGPTTLALRHLKRSDGGFSLCRYMRCLLDSLAAHCKGDRRIELFSLLLGARPGQALRPVLCDAVLDLCKGLIIAQHGTLDPSQLNTMLCDHVQSYHECIAKV